MTTFQTRNQYQLIYLIKFKPLQTKRALSEQVIIENSQTKRALSVTNSSDLSNTHSNKDNEIDSEYCDSDSDIELLEISNTKENLQNTYKKAKKIKTDEN